MKRYFFCIVLLLIISNCFSHQNNSFFKINDNPAIVIHDGEKILYKNYADYNQLFFWENAIVDYSGKQLSLQISYVINSEKTSLIRNLINTKKLKVEAISNITSLNKQWDNNQIFLDTNSFTIKEYLRDVGNGWCSDDFGFIIKSKNKSDTISMIDIKFLNIYSTYIQEGGYISPWNKQKVKQYNNQNNHGIQFYYLVEELMKTFVVKNPNVYVIGIINDDKVRFRNNSNLDSSIIRFFEHNEEVEIIDCPESLNSQEKEKFPWIKVKTKKNEIGYVYGEFVDVYVNYY